MGGDEEFDDFLRKRRRLFGPAPDDDLEPPAEIDRLVLRRAREAIETPRPQRMFRAPPWSLPVTLAATLVLAFTVILHTARAPMKAEVAKANVAVEQVSRRVDADSAQMSAAPMAEAAAPSESVASAEAAPRTEASDTATAPEASSDSIVVDLSHDRSLMAEREAKAVPAPAAPAASARASAGKSAPWRRDSKTWLAEIEKLRASGDTARANAELVEFKRTYGAYAAGPDR